MKLSTEQDFQQLLEYSDYLDGANFVETVQSNIKKQQQIRQRILAIATFCAALVVLVIAIMSGFQLWLPLIEFAQNSPYLFTVALTSIVGFSFFIRHSKI
ncbi:hypothetical protein [Kangiella sp.]|uniref:hypothetical protein n=1 Tax=Kangiella sp. TaxID=1920245 RepID=UPI0019C44981|nr:hypothetical protein [Kangiella sp.]MBD3652707.1 hypothetical protein [Kangiella sp.]